MDNNKGNTNIPNPNKDLVIIIDHFPSIPVKLVFIYVTSKNTPIAINVIPNKSLFIFFCC